MASPDPCLSYGGIVREVPAPTVVLQVPGAAVRSPTVEA
jgi:hypothetical protein